MKQSRRFRRAKILLAYISFPAVIGFLFPSPVVTVWLMLAALPAVVLKAEWLYFPMLVIEENRMYE